MYNWLFKKMEKVMSYTFLNMRPQVSAFKDSASLDVKV